MPSPFNMQRGLINERLILAALFAVLLVLFLIGELSFLAGLVVAIIASILMLQLEVKRRLDTLKLKRLLAKHQRRDGSGSPRSVRSAALHSLPSPIIMVDKSHRIVLANAAAHDLLGRDINGQDVFLFLRQSEIVDLIQAALSGELRGVSFAPIRYQAANDRVFDLTVSAIEPDREHAEMQAMIFFFEVTSLLQTEQMRVDFVANASHELRTPLSTLMGSIETLQGPAADDPEGQKRFLTIMQRESERMVRLIDDLLSLSRIEMSRHKTPSDEVDMGSLVESALNSLSEIAQKRSIVFNTQIEAGLPPVIADADQITQVLVNLLHNEAKYANEASVVNVHVAQDRKIEQVVITISDTGPGIAAEHLGRLTERFYRVDNARSRKMGGTGLGLAIVKHILLRHKSTLDIRSEIGVGTSFSFKLDAKRHAGASAQDISAVTIDDLSGTESQRLSQGDHSRRPESPHTHQSPHPDGMAPSSGLDGSVSGADFAGNTSTRSQSAPKGVAP